MSNLKEIYNVNLFYIRRAIWSTEEWIQEYGTDQAKKGEDIEREREQEQEQDD